MAQAVSDAGATRAVVLGCPVDVLDMDSAVERLAAIVEEHRRGRVTQPALVVTLNAEIVMRARRDPGFARLVRNATMVVPDGAGVVNALRRRGYVQAQRVAGPDLLVAYAERAAQLGHRIALVGAAPGVAAAAARKLLQRCESLQIAVADDGDPNTTTARRVGITRPDVVFAAYGAGRQEQFLVQHLTAMGAAAGVGIGGGLDFIAGMVRRAPRPVQNAGFEWAWRLLCEPWRIRRQAVLPLYWWHERREARRLP